MSHLVPRYSTDIVPVSPTVARTAAAAAQAQAICSPVEGCTTLDSTANISYAEGLL